MQILWALLTTSSLETCSRTRVYYSTSKLLPETQHRRAERVIPWLAPWSLWSSVYFSIWTCSRGESCMRKKTRRYKFCCATRASRIAIVSVRCGLHIWYSPWLHNVGRNCVCAWRRSVVSVIVMRFRTEWKAKEEAILALELLSDELVISIVAHLMMNSFQCFLTLRLLLYYQSSSISCSL